MPKWWWKCSLWIDLRNSVRLFHHVLYHMEDIHLVIGINWWVCELIGTWLGEVELGDLGTKGLGPMIGNKNWRISFLS